MTRNAVDSVMNRWRHPQQVHLLQAWQGPFQCTHPAQLPWSHQNVLSTYVRCICFYLCNTTEQMIELTGLINKLTAWSPCSLMSSTVNQISWLFLAGAMAALLALLWLSLLCLEKPIRLPASCPCWSANKEQEPPGEELKSNGRQWRGSHLSGTGPCVLEF